jgi:hypothetical protein
VAYQPGEKPQPALYPGAKIWLAARPAGGESGSSRRRRFSGVKMASLAGQLASWQPAQRKREKRGENQPKRL